jgi:hypothetical protein
VTLKNVVKATTTMPIRKADFRLAQATLQAVVREKGKSFHQPAYAPVAYPRMVPTARNEE